MSNCHVLGPGSIGREKRIYQLMCLAHSLDAHYQGTWCELFKSKHFKKSVCVKTHAAARARELIRKEYNAKVWTVQLIGSKSTIDVQCSRNQRFLLKITQ